MNHEDYKLNYKYHTVPVSKKYFKEMNNFFSDLEKKFQLEVIIAMHPNCYIKNYLKNFDFRKCIKSRTARLVKDSAFVISHASSTAINFAIIYNKPLIFVTTNEMQKSYLTYKRNLIKKKIFKHNFINISNLHKESFPKKFKIENQIYKNYLNNYINSCSNKKKSLGKLILENLN